MTASLGGRNKLPIGSTKTARGYVMEKVFDTGNAHVDWRLQHVLVAEKALGRPFKRGEIVHHVDGDKSNNVNSNLLICDAGYHRSLHNRMAYLYQQEHFT